MKSNNTLRRLGLAASLGSVGCINELECTDLDLEFYNAQVDTFHIEEFQTAFASQLEKAGLESMATPKKLAEIGDSLNIVCATSVDGGKAIAATKLEGDKVWYDVDSEFYLNQRDFFARKDEYIGFSVIGIAGMIPITGHEFAHHLFNWSETGHSLATNATYNELGDEFSPDGPNCHGYSLLAEQTEDKVYDVEAAVACAYEDVWY